MIIITERSIYIVNSHLVGAILVVYTEERGVANEFEPNKLIISICMEHCFFSLVILKIKPGPELMDGVQGVVT